MEEDPAIPGRYSSQVSIQSGILSSTDANGKSIRNATSRGASRRKGNFNRNPPSSLTMTSENIPQSLSEGSTDENLPIEEATSYVVMMVTTAQFLKRMTRFEWTVRKQIPLCMSPLEHYHITAISGATDLAGSVSMVLSMCIVLSRSSGRAGNLRVPVSTDTVYCYIFFRNTYVGDEFSLSLENREVQISWMAEGFSAVDSGWFVVGSHPDLYV